MKIRYIPIAAFITLSMAASSAISAKPILATDGVMEIKSNGRTSPYTLTKEEVRAGIVEILSEITSMESEDIADDLLLMDDLGLDSVDILNLILDCNNLFNINNYNLADALSYSHQYAVGSFTDMIYHFCIIDGDYVG